MNLFRNAKISESLKDKRKVHLQVEQLDERLVPAVTASLNNFGALVVNGDSQNNAITIERVGSTGSVQVFADGHYVNIAVNGSYRQSVGADNIEIYGLGGNDTISTDSLGSFQGYVLMDGGAGNDLLSMANAASYWESTLIGGSGNDILVGGRYIDHLNGGKGRDVLIGGWGADSLYGGDGEDLLMPGMTNFDFDMPTLRQISSFWGRTDLTCSQRVNGLLYGMNGYTGRHVDDSTVHTDFNKDTMYGDADMDCFYTDFSQDDVRDTGGTGEWLISVWRT